MGNTSSNRRKVEWQFQSTQHEHPIQQQGAHDEVVPRDEIERISRPEEDFYLEASLESLTSNAKQKEDIYDYIDTSKEPVYYGAVVVPRFVNQVWKGAKMVGGEPFYCPFGWFKYPVQFDSKAEKWPLAYHGTSEDVVNCILSDGGFKPGKDEGENRVYLGNGERGVYFSPSITYSAAYVWKPLQVGEKWVQTIVQVAIRNDLFEKHGGTLRGAFSHTEYNYRSPSDRVNVDSFYKGNETLEWVVKLKKNDRRVVLTSDDDIVIVGILYKVTDVHPNELPENKWKKAPLTLEHEKIRQFRN